MHPTSLLVSVLKALVERNDLDPARVDDVIAGCVFQAGEQALNIARNAVLGAGWPESVPGTTLDRQCGSSQQALHFAAATVLSGQADLVVAGGVESMSRVPMGSSAAGQDPYGTAIRQRYGRSEFQQGVGAEMVAARWGFSRTQLDEYALASHQKADAADFHEEIAPLGDVKQDEGIRRDTSL